MRLLRERVEEAKRKQAEKQGKGKQEISDLIEIAMVFGIDVENVSLLAFYNLIQRHQLKEKWQSNLSFICAGADSQKIKTKYWGESLEEE